MATEGIGVVIRTLSGFIGSPGAGRENRARACQHNVSTHLLVPKRGVREEGAWFAQGGGRARHNAGTTAPRSAPTAVGNRIPTVTIFPMGAPGRMMRPSSVAMAQLDSATDDGPNVAADIARPHGWCPSGPKSRSPLHQGRAVTSGGQPAHPFVAVSGGEKQNTAGTPVAGSARRGTAAVGAHHGGVDGGGAPRHPPLPLLPGHYPLSRAPFFTLIGVAILGTIPSRCCRGGR